MSSENQNKTTKVVLIGDSGVGKTCIISRFISNEFEKELDSTDGASYGTKELYLPKLKKKIILDIWDTAGQERYKSLTKFFYKDAQIIIMVYDITQKKSFENLKNQWYKEIQELSEKNYILAIVGNKSDLYETEQTSEKEAREFAESINAIYELTSAQNNSGIQQLFEDVGMKYLAPDFQEKIEEEQKEKKVETNIKITKKNVKKTDEEQKTKKKKFC